MPIFNSKTLHHSVVSIEDQSDWKHVLSSCEGFLSINDYNKIREYLSKDVKAVFIEKGYIDKDYRDTYYNFYSKKFAYYPNEAIRLHFFTTVVSIDNIFDLDKYQEQYVGFSVIRPTRINTLGRTIIDPSKIANLEGYICSTDYKVHILGTELDVNGFPYISQDTDVTVCAHSACWMVFRYFSERYTTYAEVLPFEVSQLTENLSYGRLVPSKGLTLYQIAEMFSKFGFYPEIYIREYYENNFDRLLYYYIESGLPVVAGLDKHSHAITILGHFSNYKKKALDNSVEYIDGFIINDDNYLPYQKLLQRGPSDFCVEEFKPPLTIERLCKVINDDNYNITLKVSDNEIGRLNELLSISDFYDILQEKKPNLNFSKNITELIDKTKEYRNKGFPNLSKYKQDNIKRLNRLLLEETYPQETPKILQKDIKKDGYCSKFHVEDIDNFVVPLYEKIYFSAEYVDRAVEAVLNNKTFGINAVSKLIRKENIIKRIFLTSSKSYKAQRRKQNLPFNLSLTYSSMNMPKFVWICELSTNEFYQKGEIVGEIIFDATANHLDPFAFLSIHYPDFIVFNDRNYLTNAPERFISGNLVGESLQPYPIYKNNLREI